MELIKITSIDRKNYNFLQLVAFIVDDCNYTCSYCYNKKPRTFQKLDLDRLYEYIIFLKSTTQQYIELNILGGEPTLHPDLYDFCKKISMLQDIVVIIYSNLSSNIQLYKKILALNNIRFDLSYHSINSVVNKQYIKNLTQLVLNSNYSYEKINITLMIENKQAFDDIYNLNQTFNKLNINKLHNIDYRLVHNFFNASDKSYYTDKEYEFFKMCINTYDFSKALELKYNDDTVKHITIEEFDLLGIYNFKYWKCGAGIEEQYCHCDGNLYHCQSEYIENKKPFSNIMNEFIKLTECIICDCDTCRCDTETTKCKINN